MVSGVFILLLTVAMSVGLVGEVRGTQLGTEQLISTLQKGGFVLYLRHAKTKRTAPDQHPVNFKSCAGQRNLSDEGRAQAKTIAATFRKLDIKFTSVISSPYCRCIDTATSIAGNVVKVDPRLAYAVAQSSEDRAVGRRRLRNLLGQPVEAGNRLIVGHTSNLHEASGIWPEEEGDAWVFQPLGGDNFKVLGQLRAHQYH
jgi:phosphohistidine phosphatase SixA